MVGSAVGGGGVKNLAARRQQLALLSDLSNNPKK